MDYFNKEEFQQLKNLPRSVSKKRATMDRIRTSSIKPPRNYPVRYVITSIAVILLATILIIPEFLSLPEQANEPPEVTPNAPTIEPDENENVTSILNTLEIGMSEDEVKQVLGKYNLTGEWKGPSDNGVIGRYEIKKNGEYIYEIEGESTRYYLEFEAMNEGKIGMLLFILWDEQHSVKQYSAIYKDWTDEKIYDVRVSSNGTLAKQPIYPTENIDPENIMIDIELVKTQIKLGMTMEEVKNLLGHHYKTIVDVYTGRFTWDYNFGTEPNKDEYGIDYPQGFEEMLQGNFHAEVSILWDINNLVSSLYVMYKNENENKIYEYVLFADGQSKDEPLYPF